MLYSEYSDRYLSRLTFADPEELGKVSNTIPTSRPGPMAEQLHWFNLGGAVTITVTTGALFLGCVSKEPTSQRAFGAYAGFIIVYLVQIWFFRSGASRKRLLTYLQCNSVSWMRRAIQLVQAIATYPLISGLGSLMVYTSSSLATLIMVTKTSPMEDYNMFVMFVVIITFVTLLWSILDVNFAVIAVNGVPAEPRLAFANGRLSQGVADASR